MCIPVLCLLCLFFCYSEWNPLPILHQNPLALHIPLISKGKSACQCTQHGTHALDFKSMSRKENEWHVTTSCGFCAEFSCTKSASNLRQNSLIRIGCRSLPKNTHQAPLGCLLKNLHGKFRSKTASKSMSNPHLYFKTQFRNKLCIEICSIQKQLCKHIQKVWDRACESKRAWDPLWII